MGRLTEHKVNAALEELAGAPFAPCFSPCALPIPHMYAAPPLVRTALPCVKSQDTNAPYSALSRACGSPERVALRHLHCEQAPVRSSSFDKVLIHYINTLILNFSGPATGCYRHHHPDTTLMST